MKRHPVPVQVTRHHNAGGRLERTQEPSKNGRVELGHPQTGQGSPLLAQPSPSSLFCPRPPSHHPAKPRCTSYPPSAYFLHQHRSSHTLLIHSVDVSKPSQYSLIHFSRQLFELFYPPLHQQLSNRDTPTKHLKPFILIRFIFHLSALLIPHASAPYNVVGTITSSYRYGLLPAAQFPWNSLGCTDPLLTISHYLQKSLDAGMESYLVQLDFSAAIDRVSNSGLLFKLKSISVGGSELSICIEFVSDRRQ